MRVSIWIAAMSVLVAGCEGTTQPGAEEEASGVLLADAAHPGIDLGTLGGALSFALDINDRGTVVGWSQTSSGENHAFRWSKETGMVDLGTLPGDVRSIAVSILNSGRILGWSSSADFVTTPVVWTKSGEIHPLPIPPLAGAFGNMAPADFNKRGEVVGQALDDLGFEHGWYWSEESGTVDLRDEIFSCLENGASAINARGLVAGSYCDPGTRWLHAFIWRLGEPFRDLGIVGEDPNANAVARDVNDAGVVAGWIDPHGNTATRAFLWTAREGYTLLPILPGGESFSGGAASGINERRVAVGSGYNIEHDAIQPLAWPSPKKIVKLGGRKPHSGTATAINELGQVVGWISSDETGGNNRARLWVLRNERFRAVAEKPSEEGRAPRASRAGPAGPAEACLADPKALASKAALARCLLGTK